MANEKQSFEKLTASVAKKATSDNKISGKEATSLAQKYGSSMVATALAQAAMANPELQIGKNVKPATGLKITGTGDSRVATYDPSRVTGMPSLVDSSMVGTKYGTNWYQTGSGAYTYGGPAGTPFASTTTAGGGTPAAGAGGAPMAPQIPYKPDFNLEDILAGIERLFANQEQQAMLREQMQREASRTLAANMARSGQMPNLSIAPASRASELAGTQPFKRQGPYAPGYMGSIPALNVKQPDVLNI